MKNKSVVLLDFLGISSASLCIVHCLIFPVLSVIPLGLTNNQWIDIFFACIGMFVVSKIVLSKTPFKIKLLLVVAISIIVTGVVLETIWCICTPLVLIGGIGMIVGHILNYNERGIKKI